MSNHPIARRRVLIGLGLAALGTVLGACSSAPPTPAKPAEPAAKPTQPPAQAPTATPAPVGAPTKPAAARGGTVKLLYWQAPTILNPHLATGTKDIHAARIVLEPLMTVDREGKFLPILAAEIPSRQNGGLSEDGKTVTYKLKKDVKWAD